MKNQVTLRLSGLCEEIAATAARLDRLRDRLDAQGALLEECRLRMLIAETPLAAGELHGAALGYGRLEAQVHDLERLLGELEADARHLTDP